MNRKFYIDIIRKSQAFQMDWARRAMNGKIQLKDMRIFANEYNQNMENHKEVSAQYKADMAFLEKLSLAGTQDYEGAIFLVGAMETMRRLIEQHIKLAKVLNKGVERAMGLKPGSLRTAPEDDSKAKKAAEDIDPYGKTFH